MTEKIFRIVSFMLGCTGVSFLLAVYGWHTGILSERVVDILVTINVTLAGVYFPLLFITGWNKSLK